MCGSLASLGAGRNGKTIGLELAANGRSALENCLLSPISSGGEGWTLADLQIVSGVLSDDGSALRRFGNRLRWRLCNAQVETEGWLRVHETLVGSFRVAYELQNENGNCHDDEEVVEVKILDDERDDEREER